RRIVLHDPRGALGAEHALVHRVVAVSFDVADAAVLQAHVDAAAAGAHVAGGLLDLVRDLRRRVDLLGRAREVLQEHEWSFHWAGGRRAVLRSSCETASLTVKPGDELPSAPPIRGPRRPRLCR